jgi:hypothetical protein
MDSPVQRVEPTRNLVGKLPANWFFTRLSEVTASINSRARSGSHALRTQKKIGCAQQKITGQGARAGGTQGPTAADY